jgi:ketosteroid isomerase-like protein
MTRTTLAAVLLCTSMFRSDLPARGVSQGESFNQFLKRWEAAQTRFINGDPTLWKQMASHRDDVTVLGGFGGEGEKGWQAVGARYDWASAQYRPAAATLKVDYHTVAVHGDLAYTVGIERQTGVLVGAQPSAVNRSLRVTHVFRREKGEWKLVHRHGDQMAVKQEAVPTRN